MSEAIKDILRLICSSLQVPTIVILIILIIVAVIMLGSFLAEIFTERRKLKVNIPDLIDEMQGKNAKELEELIKNCGLLKRQREAALRLVSRSHLPDDTREALARQLLADEESHYAKVTKITDLVARIAPMFGLMGTLIPLGPGIIALGQGDTKTLAGSLLIAFDTTVAGLISAAVSYFISGIRKSWYEQYVVGLETILETILEEQSREKREKEEAQKKKDNLAVQQNQASYGKSNEITREQFLAYARKLKAEKAEKEAKK